MLTKVEIPPIIILTHMCAYIIVYTEYLHVLTMERTPMPYVRSSPYNAEDRSGVRVQLGVCRKVMPRNSTDTEGEESEAAGPPK